MKYNKRSDDEAVNLKDVAKGNVHACIYHAYRATAIYAASDDRDSLERASRIDSLERASR
jgi:hypothetical protein